jgi:16S rRNA (guanine527-N7)-methyltransferase
VTDPTLLQVLHRSRELGFLGPGPVEAHVDHAVAMARTVESFSGASPARFLDLGSGGGVPGLVLARRWPEAAGALLDSNQRRTNFLVEACDALGLPSQVEVIRARAEEAGRDRRWRGAFPLVVARSFGSPSVTAECAAPFVLPGGLLIVSEPPEPVEDRWPAEGLGLLGLEVCAPVPVAGAHLCLLRAAIPCPDRYPRRTGVPAKRPLF